MSVDLKIKRQRSPNFPAETLEKCIEIARKLYDRYKRTSVAQEIAIKGLGLSPTSGGAIQLIAALSAFGLIDVDGSGATKRLKLSELAYNIIEDKRPTSEERDWAIRQAALTPSIFIRLFDEYQEGLPPEDAFAHDLKFKHGFNPKSVVSFINIITSTFDYAKVYNSDKIPQENTAYHRQEQVSERDNVMEKIFATQKPTSSFIQMPTPSTTETKQEIAKYLVGQGKTISLMSDGVITQKSILKLIKKLEMDVEDFPADDETTEPPEIKSN